MLDRLAAARLRLAHLRRTAATSEDRQRDLHPRRRARRLLRHADPWHAAVQRSEVIIVAAIDDRRHFGRPARLGGADVGLRRVDQFVRRFDVGIAGERDRDRILGGRGQVRKRRRRLQIDRRLPDEADIALAAGDQIGFGGAQIALGQREPRFGLRDVGARQIADLEPVARRLQVDAQRADIGKIEGNDRAVPDDIHIGADHARKDRCFRPAEIGLPCLHTDLRRLHAVAHRPTLVDGHVDRRRASQRPVGR